MNTILSIPFSLLFLIQSMGPVLDLCCELQKLPEFFEHYEEHAEKYGTSIVEFLDIHYGDEQKQDEAHHDDEHDKNLPFHGQHQCFHAFVFITPLPGQLEVATLYYSIPTKTSRYIFSIGTEYSVSPFQPPKAWITWDL